MSAMLGARAYGEKFSILFILRGQPGDLIEHSELESFPMGHLYAVLESTWMDERVWTYYLESLLKLKVREPSVLLVDNFDSHISAQGQKTAEQVGRLVSAIPPNATSIVKLLDVGVMVPFKRHLRDLWLQEDLIEGEDGDEEHDRSSCLRLQDRSELQCLLERSKRGRASPR
ncbi:Aste57867_24148 [Aphanomyces stellatus]|uniref:Aste57867_24148 protein n=1 Tax=Aphanomyces stellatus TaxID=120398 RepID=A0A485LRF6_9STRA|nr:hypothetical protein As57867_024074 [Aphanomyces stellatus]KAF0715279.1 hypothetical protein As57867_003437 [Aphanomyces stellatus]KAF0715303.1 hypothetical protein As57867_003461 [Aphanomyces stellatus]VFT80613.1 Aste57867_3447 [Aphanomyces stellatus]VFT80637.1 Aste57867_3471 [Aphanomyces stellatus]